MLQIFNRRFFFSCFICCKEIYLYLYSAIACDLHFVAEGLNNEEIIYFFHPLVQSLGLIPEPSTGSPSTDIVVVRDQAVFS